MLSFFIELTIILLTILAFGTNIAWFHEFSLLYLLLCNVASPYLIFFLNYCLYLLFRLIFIALAATQSRWSCPCMADWLESSTDWTSPPCSPLHWDSPPSTPFAWESEAVEFVLKQEVDIWIIECHFFLFYMFIKCNSKFTFWC